MEDSYAPHVVWHAPRRGLVWRGSSQVLAGLAREAAAMRAARDIERLDLPYGAKVELRRLRILTCVDLQVIAETCFETWSVLANPGEY